MKTSKKQILKEVLTALMDDNNQVLVETLGAHPNRNIPGVWRSAVGEVITETPLPQPGNEHHNRRGANAVKIGKEISIKVTIHGQFVIHTPAGQVRFGCLEAKETGLDRIWHAALNKYEHGANSDFLYPVKEYAPDEELRMIAKGTKIPAQQVSKFEQAKKQLEGLGVSPDRVTQYYARTHGRDE